MFLLYQHLYNCSLNLFMTEGLGQTWDQQQQKKQEMRWFFYRQNIKHQRYRQYIFYWDTP